MIVEIFKPQTNSLFAICIKCNFGIQLIDYFLSDFISSSLQILQLEKRLQDQVAVRGALEKALGYRPISHDLTNEISMPKVAHSLSLSLSYK